MAEQTAPRESAPSKRLTKGQAVTMMVAGGVLMILPMIIPTEQGSMAHTLKVVVGFMGFCVLCAGAYLRP